MKRAFNLDLVLTAWRRSMEHKKVLLPEDLEELESHIRDQVAELVDRGQSEEQAYTLAMRAMGADPVTEDAYRKVYWGKLKRKGMLRQSLSVEIRMLKNYLTLAFRNLRRRKGYAAINIAGLSVGIGACILILLFAKDEYSFDRFHEHADRIVRVTLQDRSAGSEMEVTPTIVGPLFKRTFSQVQEAARVYDISRFRSVTIRRGATAWQQDHFIYADSTIFDVLSLPFVVGRKTSALNRANTLVLTETAAIRYFGDVGSAMGQILDIGAGTDFQVTGVLADLPSNSHLQFEVIGSFESTSWASREIWGSANFYTYLLLRSPADLEPLQAEMDRLLTGARESQGIPAEFGLGLQRLTDIYLVFMRRAKYVWMFGSLAVLILFMACINYINLSTARAARRAREVGVRKALGAHRTQLVRQFFSESVLMTALGLVGGLFLVAISLPVFNQLTAKSISFDLFVEIGPWLFLGALLLTTTIGAGWYPAIMLSRFQPAVVLKGSKGSRASGASLRRLLVAFQFAVTVFLIVSTTVVYQQLQFIRSSDVGFDRDRVVVVQLANSNVRQAVPAIRQALRAYPGAEHSAVMNAIPGNQRGGYSLRRETNVDGDQVPNIAATPVGAGVIATLGLKLVAGRGFSQLGNPLSRPDSARYQYVVNQDLVRAAGWTTETAIGQRMSVSGGRRMGEVVGVIENYNFLPLSEQMEPLALFIEPSWNVLLIKLSQGPVTQAVQDLREIWNEATGGSPFQYSFLDDDYNEHYRSEERLATLFGGASQLAIVIACLGLFGLAAFTAEERTREIGIRKALGASVPGLIGMLNKEFALLVLAGFLIATPLAWLASSGWLSTYAFRMELGMSTFLLAGLAAFLVAGLTVSFQSVRAARRDPVTALRHDQ